MCTCVVPLMLDVSCLCVAINYCYIIVRTHIRGIKGFSSGLRIQRVQKHESKLTFLFLSHVIKFVILRGNILLSVIRTHFNTEFCCMQVASISRMFIIIYHIAKITRNQSFFNIFLYNNETQTNPMAIFLFVCHTTIVNLR